MLPLMLIRQLSPSSVNITILIEWVFFKQDVVVKTSLLTFVVVLVTIQQAAAHGTTSQDLHGNPCHEIYENTTISTPHGKILCVVPSEDELAEQLKSVGGYNKHYVARTQKEVDENFQNLLPWDGAATTLKQVHHGHPSVRPMQRPNKKRPKTKRSLSKRFTSSWENVHKTFVDEENSLSIAFADEDDGNKRSLPREPRMKRSHHPSGIVSSSKIGCVSKGQTVGRQKLKQMCDICQRSSELDIDRFPRYINELTCETANGSPSQDGNSCSYHSYRIGTCVQSSMTIDLLRRTDKYTVISPPPSGDYFMAYKQIWKPYTQEIRSCCQCRY